MDEILNLESQIKEYAEAYYSGDALVSDEEFDALVERLKEISPESEVLKTPGWGYEPAENKKVPHRYGLFVGSLPKIKEGTALPSQWSTSLRVSAKLDGISVVSYYEKGHRVLSLTRGNGSQGLDVTKKINIISPETETLSKTFTGAVRGEVLCDVDTWKSLKETRFKDNPSANSRNFTAGVMNRNEESDDLKNLKYVVYKIIADPERVLSSRIDSRYVDMDKMSDTLKEFTFVPCRYINTSSEKTPETLKNLFEEFCKVYPCDGLVLTSMSVTYDKDTVQYEEIAYKFGSESKEVTVTKVTWTPSRTGRIVPRVWFDPVELSGAVVQKCTGFNAAFIKNNHIAKGAKILVCRSGEVIPHILKVITPSTEVKLLPTVCPSCGEDLYWKGEDLVCVNETGRQLPYRFLSVAGEIPGAGYSTYNLILDTFEVTDQTSLMNFLSLIKKYWDTEEKEQRIVSRIYDNVSGEATRDLCIKILDKIYQGIDSRTFLVACNIKGLSWEVSKNLMTNYPEFLKDATKTFINEDRLRKIPGVGSSMVATLRLYRRRICDLYLSTNVVDYEPLSVPSGGFSVAITGSLSIKRSEFDALLQSKGISQSSNFKEIKYLITNNPDTTSSKMRKAKENNVEIISESKFFEKFLK